MIAYITNRTYFEGTETKKYYVEIACLSTDTKPTEDLITGSSAIEADTGDFYLYDEASETWNKMCSIKEE